MVRYCQMMNKLKWDSLYNCRNILRLQMMYKITHQTVDLKLPDYITYNYGITWGHDYKLTLPPTRIDSYKYSYFPATITLWNKLPNETVNATSIDTFAELIAHWLCWFLYSIAFILACEFCNYYNNNNNLMLQYN